MERDEQEDQNIQAHSSAPLRRKGGSLGSIVAGFKSAVTKKINQHRNTPGTKIWQRSYYDHIIRDENDLEKLRHYVRYNPEKWPQDQENLESASLEVAI